MKKKASVIIIYFVLGIMLCISMAYALQIQDEVLKTRYEPILGEYEFSTTEGTFYLNFYIEEGALWADSGDGRPAEMKAFEDEMFKFKAEDPQSGIFIFQFLKDDQGEFSICHVLNEGMGLDIKGSKIK